MCRAALSSSRVGVPCVSSALRRVLHGAVFTDAAARQRSRMIEGALGRHVTPKVLSHAGRHACVCASACRRERPAVCVVCPWSESNRDRPAGRRPQPARAQEGGHGKLPARRSAAARPPSARRTRPRRGGRRGGPLGGRRRGRALVLRAAFVLRAALCAALRAALCAALRADLPSLGETPLWPGRTTYAVPLPRIPRVAGTHNALAVSCSVPKELSR